MSLAIPIGDSFSNKHNRDSLFFTELSTKSLIEANSKLFNIDFKTIENKFTKKTKNKVVNSIQEQNSITIQFKLISKVRQSWLYNIDLSPYSHQ